MTRKLMAFDVAQMGTTEFAFMVGNLCASTHPKAAALLTTLEQTVRGREQAALQSLLGSCCDFPVSNGELTNKIFREAVEALVPIVNDGLSWRQWEEIDAKLQHSTETIIVRQVEMAEVTGNDRIKAAIAQLVQPLSAPREPATAYELALAATKKDGDAKVEKIHARRREFFDTRIAQGVTPALNRDALEGVLFHILQNNGPWDNPAIIRSISHAPEERRVSLHMVHDVRDIFYML